MTAPTQDGEPRRPRLVVWKEPPITLGDRLAAAVVCVLAMAGFVLGPEHASAMFGRLWAPRASMAAAGRCR